MPGAGELTAQGQKELFEVMEMIYVLTGTAATQAYPFVKVGRWERRQERREERKRGRKASSTELSLAPGICISSTTATDIH